MTPKSSFPVTSKTIRSVAPLDRAADATTAAATAHAAAAVKPTLEARFRAAAGLIV
jgi:hypothetical protein